MNTISFSFVSLDVPNVFCAQPLWEQRKCGLFDVLLFFNMNDEKLKMISSTTLFDACHKYRPRFRPCTNVSMCRAVKQCSIYPPNDLQTLRKRMMNTKSVCGNRTFNTCRGKPMMNSEIQIHSSSSNLNIITKSITALGYLEINNTSKKNICTVYEFLRSLNIHTTVWKQNIGSNGIASSWGYQTNERPQWTPTTC